MDGLTEKEISRIKEELENSQRPIFFFHDDADGLASFLLLYRYIKEGKGVVVKSKPAVDARFATRAIDYEADKAFVLDIAMLKQEFVDAIKRPVIWVDHHKPYELNKVNYFNPRKHKPDIVYPVTRICYEVVKQDLWVAMVGCVGDWYVPNFKEEFCKKYPDLMDVEMDEPGEILFNTRLGELVKIFNFVLKGSTSDTNKCVKVLTRIKSPYEILDNETPQGVFVYRRYQKINKVYEELLKEAKKEEGKDEDFLIYTYPDNRMSFTGEISNELLYLYPKKVIIVAREKDGEMRMSLRSSSVNIAEILERSLTGIWGYGGGHEYACGACVKKEDFKDFVENLRKGIKESS
jgi:single-stranded DNA-specific DHH superfamily exonuclease